MLAATMSTSLCSVPRRAVSIAACSCLWSFAVMAQDAPPAAATTAADPIQETAVRDTVGWLAADERRGRASGSPELAATAQWIADAFARAGLEQLQPGTWFHEFDLPGQLLDSGAIELKLSWRVGEDTGSITFVADQDVRQSLPADTLTGEEACTVVRADDPGLDRLLMLESARRPVIVEVPEDDPAWLAAAGEHSVITRVRRAARPVFLVRQGTLATAKVSPETSWQATYKVAAAGRADVVQRNVLGVRRAAKDSQDASQYVAVSAHYDHVGVGRAVDGDAIYNGADDDATGTTAVLLLAEALARLPAPRRNVLFVCFAAEERGLLGSKAFCEHPPLPLDQIVADLNIEMIGRPEPGNEGKAWITGPDLSDFAAICGVALERAGIGLVDFRMADQLFAQSDNFSFARRGVVAHSLSAGSLHADYHQPSDEVEKLDIPHMTRIVRGLRECTLELANRAAAPQWTEAGKQRLERARR